MDLQATEVENLQRINDIAPLGETAVFGLLVTSPDARYSHSAEYNTPTRPFHQQGYQGISCSG